MDYPTYDLIVAAIGGDEEAMEKILQHYEPMIAEQCDDDEDMRQEVILALIDAILHYDLNSPERNEEYLKTYYPDHGDQM